MRKLYDKDECIPDSKKAVAVLDRLFPDFDHTKLSFVIWLTGDTYQVWMRGQYGLCFMIEYSCGAYETLYEVSYKEFLGALNSTLNENNNFNISFVLTSEIGNK